MVTMRMSISMLTSYNLSFFNTIQYNAYLTSVSLIICTGWRVPRSIQGAYLTAPTCQLVFQHAIK